MMLKSVVFPAPFGPMMPWMRPCSTASETPSSTTMPPKLLRRPSTLKMGSATRPAPRPASGLQPGRGRERRRLVLGREDHVGLAGHELRYREEEALHEAAGHHLVGRERIRARLRRPAVHVPHALIGHAADGVGELVEVERAGLVDRLDGQPGVVVGDAARRDAGIGTEALLIV